jgi:hypothetical protein
LLLPVTLLLLPLTRLLLPVTLLLLATRKISCCVYSKYRVHTAQLFVISS